MFKAFLFLNTILMASLSLAVHAPLPTDESKTLEYDICDHAHPTTGGVYAKFENGKMGAISDKILNSKNCWKTSSLQTEEKPLQAAQIETRELAVEGVKEYSAH